MHEQKTPSSPTPSPLIVPYSNLATLLAAQSKAQNGTVPLVSGDAALLLTDGPAGKSAEISFWDTKAGKRTTIALYAVAGGLAVFISGYFITLALERNLTSVLMQSLEGSASFIFNVLPAFFFNKSAPGFFTRFASYSWIYRVSAPTSFAIGTLSTAAAVKFGTDAIFGNQYAFVRKLGWPIVIAYLMNNETTRVFGGTDLLNRAGVFLLQFFKHEWKHYENLFTFFEDLKMYGPYVKNFTYPEGTPIAEIAQLFYAELDKTGVRPIPRTGKAFLEAYRLGISAASTFLAVALWPMWLYAAENGLNATSLLWGDGKFGSEHPTVTALAGLANEIFYLNFATRIYDYTIDLSTLLFKRKMHSVKGNTPTRVLSTRTKLVLGALAATTVALGGLYLVAGYLSGAGMGKEGHDAYAARCREDNSSQIICGNGNSTFDISNTTFYAVTAYPAHLLDGLWGIMATLNAGNLANGIASMDVARRVFNSGTIIGPDKDPEHLGVNDALDELNAIIRGRQYHKLGKYFDGQMATIEAIGLARGTWTQERNLTVTGEIYNLFPNCGRRPAKRVEEGRLISGSTPSPTPTPPFTPSPLPDSRSGTPGYQPVLSGSEDGSEGDLHVDSRSPSPRSRH